MSLRLGPFQPQPLLSDEKEICVHSVRSNLREGGFFKLRVLLGVLLCFAARDDCPVCAGQSLSATSHIGSQTNTPTDGLAAANKIAPWVMEHTANGEQAEFSLCLRIKPIWSSADLQTKAAKGRYVYNTLLSKSPTTQGPILQWLRERGLDHRSFCVVNAILVNGDREVAEAFAARPDVARVEGNPHVQNSLPEPDPAVEAPPYLQRPEAVEPGIITHTRRRSGRWGSPGRTLLLQAPTPAFVGRITH